MVVKTYNAQQQKGSVHKLDFSNYKRATEVSLHLDESGRNVVVLKQPITPTKYKYQSLIVSKNGGLKANDKVFVYPAYRFKNNFVKNMRWIIPTYHGIALPAGSHNLRTICNGTWIETNQAYVDWGKRIREIDDKILHPKPGAELSASQKDNLQKERYNLIQNEPKPMGFDRSDTEISFESFTVFLSPFHDQF